ncbi:MAG: META domain-containing protein [Deltaproteobacteria bacterium]|nr:META domain-containing protein [Deltaproteobacteria bacterium]
MILTVAVCPGCSGLHGSTGKPSISLENTDWKLAEFRGKEVIMQPGRPSPYLRLLSSDSRVVGHGGCNRFFGGYKLEGDRLRFSALGSTKMACPRGIGDLEDAFFNALGSARRFKISGDVLEVFDDSELIARFKAVKGM